jgi:hypothetical protein
MASLRERLEYVVTVDAKQAVKSLEEVGKTTERELSKSESRIDRAGVSLTKFGVGAMGVAGAVGVGLYKIGSAASDVEESVNAVNVTFGEAAEGVLALSDAAAQSVGLSKAEFNGLAVAFAGFAKQLDGDVTQSIDDLTTRAADFASVMNMDVNEAARIYVELVKAGDTPSDAARKLHRKLSDLRMDEDFTRRAASIIENGYLPAEVRKALVRSGLNMRFVKGIDSDDPELRRDALTAAKMIAEDPEVGLKHTAPAIEIDLTVLGDILAQVEDKKGDQE